MSVDEDHEEPGSRREGSCRGPFWIRVGFLEGDVILKLESGTPKTNYQGKAPTVGIFWQRFFPADRKSLGSKGYGV